jgi:hypothetical protein
MTFKRLLGIAMAVFAVAVLVGSVGAGAARTPARHAVDLSTNTKVRDYLRSLGISPRGVVIQRGARNYAGPNCPGKAWTCTSTAHRVVQVASTGGKNVFRCSTARCAVVQASETPLAIASEAPLAINTAKCIRTTGITQSCSISQTSTGSNENQAIVVEIARKLAGLTQNASQTAQIVQRADSGANTACVLQTTEIEGSTNVSAKKGVPINVNLGAHQSVTITQDSHNGVNTVTNASPSGTCDSGNPTPPDLPNPLTQTQTLRSTAVGSGAITQNENAVDAGSNMSLDIKQNQSDTFFGSATGANTAVFNQTNTLTAIASTSGSSPPSGVLVSQTQSSMNGGVLATVNQDSTGVNTANATQTETQCEDAHAGGPLTCDRDTQDPPGYSLTQTQYGPVKKGDGDSAQTGGNPGSTFTINQSSTQDNDTGNNQTNVVQGDCSTSGTCTVTQTTTVNGDSTTNTQSGSSVETGINCTGSTCTTFTAGENVLVAGTGDLGDPEPNHNLTQLLTSVGYSVTESASLPADLSSFGQVWWVDANPPTSDEQNQLIEFAESGKGVFLTGERPCCEALNAADQFIVNSVVVGGGITVGGQGDVCGCTAPLPVNPGVVGGVATQPFVVTSWQPSAPGGMANVPDSSVFSYYQPGDPSTRQVVAAVWDRPSVAGNGRLVVFMDINWTEVAYRAANWSDVAQNVAFFLSGLSSPPGPVVTAATVVPAAPALFAAKAQATPRTALGGASTTR